MGTSTLIRPEKWWPSSTQAQRSWTSHLIWCFLKKLEECSKIKHKNYMLLPSPLTANKQTKKPTTKWAKKKTKPTPLQKLCTFCTAWHNFNFLFNSFHVWWSVTMGEVKLSSENYNSRKNKVIVPFRILSRYSLIGQIWTVKKYSTF